MKLERTKQCSKCPWKTSVNANDIPNGYSLEKHKNLRCTIADVNAPLSTIGLTEQRVMACHETENAHCVGWLYNQLGIGNNVGLRISMMKCENIGMIKVTGEQHERFEYTFPQST